MRALAYIASRPALRISLIYIVFASAWILLSDDFLRWIVPDASGITEMQTYKGAVFVLFTGALLYRLVSRLQDSAPLHNNSLDPPQLGVRKFFPVLIFSLLMLVIGFSGWHMFSALRDAVRDEAEQALIVSGKLKANQIENWLKERKDNLFDAADGHSAAVLVEWMRSGKGGESLGGIAKRFDALKKTHAFTAIEVYDKDGSPRFGDGIASVLEHGDVARKVIAANAFTLVDFHRGSANGPIAFGMMVPLRIDGQVRGALYAELDPTSFLYPLIQDWPGTSKTGETLLLRQENGKILYLNELRYRKNSALTFGNAGPDILSMAYPAGGKYGFLKSFKDYRGEPVLGYVSEIRGTPWLMLAKVDQAEAYADVDRLGLISALATILLIGISGFGVWLWWQHRQEYFTRISRQEALDRQALEANYNALSKYANDIILLADKAGKIIQANDKALETYGYTSAELIGRRICELDDEQSRVDCDQQRTRLEQEGACRYETFHRRKDDSKFPVEVSARLIEQGDHHFIHMVLRDISERKQAEESTRLATLVYQHSSEAMMVTDIKGVIISINPAFTDLTGYTAEEAIGKPTSILKSGHQDDTFYKDFWHAIKTAGHWEGEIWNRRKNGEIFPEWLRINSIKNTDGSVHRLVALFSDITQKKASEALIWQQANFDVLTGLPNRRMFYDRLDQEIKKSRRSGLPMALMFLDLDRFKEVNDTLGHDVGDILLKEAAQRLRSCVRTSDTVARLGGDEFTVIMSDLEDSNSIERVAEDILHKLMEPFQLGLETIYVSASIGITLYPADATELDALLRNADQAMYAAKHQGRNRFNYFTAFMQDAAQARMQLANSLRVALAERQLRVHYQPIVELANGEIHKAEALVRWQHPRLGLLNPGEFVPVSEETGLIIDIGNWVFHEVAAQVARWRSLFHADFQISLNSSPVQFHDDSKMVGPDWFEYLEKLGLAGQCLVVEITEAVLLDASPLVLEKILGLRDAGVQVALDNFGTGYSSLAHLRKFDIDYLKIDKSFVQNLAPGSDDMALCEAIIVMAHKLGIKVIAEGVETVAQRDLLMAAGCDYGQGFLFSKPLPVEEFEALLKSRSTV